MHDVEVGVWYALSVGKITGPVFYAEKIILREYKVDTATVFQATVR
jgi:hypothetical protein